MNTWRVIQNIGLVTLIGISLTCDSNIKDLSHNTNKTKSDIKDTIDIPMNKEITQSLKKQNILDTITTNIIDTLEQWDISIQNKIIQDTTNTDTTELRNRDTATNIINTTTKWPNEKDITVWHNIIVKTMSQEECDVIMQSQLKKAVEEIVVQTDKLNFDLEYMRGEVSYLLEDFFLLQYTDDWLELKFLWVKDTDHKNIMNHMDNIRSHIKSNNWILVKIFLSKSKLREYTTENIPVVYKILSKNNSIEYEWWEHQFTKDINSIINIYK